MKKAFSSKEPRYDAAICAEALCLASESHSTLSALPADSVKITEVRALCLANKTLAQMASGRTTRYSI
jgi:hypothetical protein